MIEGLIRVDTKDILQELITSVIDSTVDGTPFLETLNPKFTTINFIYGNADDNNNRIDSNQSLQNNPLAFIFLPKGIQEYYNYDLDDRDYINARVKIYFLIGINIKNNDVLGHYSKAIDPCKDIWHKLVQNSDTVVRSCQTIYESNLKDHIEFGLIKFEFGQKGKAILDGKFSGIEVDFNLSIDKQLKKCT